MDESFKLLISDLNDNMIINNNGLEYIKQTDLGILKELKNKEELKLVVEILERFEEFLIPNVMESIQDYALNHQTHNDAKLKAIRNKNQYFQIKQDLFSDISTLILNEDISENYFDNKEVIFIENQYIFEQSIEEFKDYFSNFEFEYKNKIIIYGSGNRSTSFLLKEYLKKAKKIYCFYDLDMRGFKMFESLIANLNIEPEFMIPGEVVILNTQEKIRKKYETANITDKEKFQLITTDSELYKLIYNRTNRKLKKPLYCMYEESFVSF